MSARKIADYGFLSDCHSAALVSRDGSIDWYCVPRFDSPSVFGRLLGDGAGHWLLRPRGDFSVHREYVGNSLVLRTVFTTASGRIELVDALALQPGSRGHHIGFRVPHMMLRRVTALDENVQVEMEFAPRFEYGLTAPRLVELERGVVAHAGPTRLQLTCDIDLEVRAGTARADFSLAAGTSRYFSLTYARTFSEVVPPRLDARHTLDDTIAAWESWMRLHLGYEGLYIEEVRRSALVLQGLTYQPSGAVIAAATTSLPEVRGRDANWDYRFAWLRDLSLTLQAQWIAACPDEAGRFFSWVSGAVGELGDAPVQIMFGVEGERDISERVLDHLEGFSNSRPVRVGNDAWRQKQLDVLGEVPNAADIVHDALGEFDADTRELLKTFAGRAAQIWGEPDAGMWETRDEERHYVSSKVLCWVALDRAIKMSSDLGADAEEVDNWSQAREEVRAAILREAWSDDINAYAGAFGSDELDASVLLMPLVGFLDAGDDRMRATIELIEKQLGDGGLVRRWGADPSGFIITSYWLVECLALAGQTERALKWFERISAYRNDVGLLSEEVELATGNLLGNFPQAFSHVGLINAAWRLTETTASHR